MTKESLLQLVGILILITAGAWLFFNLTQPTTDEPATLTTPTPSAETLSDEVEQTDAETTSEVVPTPEPATTKTNDNSAAKEPIADETIAGTPVTDTPPAVTSAIVDETTPAQTAGIYTDYDPSLLANAADGTVILFFHASWCPSCRSLDRSITENNGDIPTDVTILQVNYDTATELKRKHGVTRQHTLVQVDTNGDTINTINGLTNSLDQVLGKI